MCHNFCMLSCPDIWEIRIDQKKNRASQTKTPSFKNSTDVAKNEYDKVFYLASSFDTKDFSVGKENQPTLISWARGPAATYNCCGSAKLSQKKAINLLGVKHTSLYE